MRQRDRATKKVRRSAAADPDWTSFIDVPQHRDCVEGMRLMPDASVDAAFCDPPFNIGRNYASHDDDMDPVDYLRWSTGWIDEAVRVLKPTGSLWICISEEFQAELKVIAEGRYGLTCKDSEGGRGEILRTGKRMKPRHHVIWFFTFGICSPRKLTRAHTHLLHFVKSAKNHTWNPDQVRVPSARQAIYNDKRANPEGRLPDDTWILRPNDPRAGFDADSSVLYQPRVNGTFKERQSVDNQMPEALVGRVLRLCTNPGDLVLDPFGGSFTTAAVARKLGRRFVSFEVDAACVAQGTIRTQSAREGDPLHGVDYVLVTRRDDAPRRKKAKARAAEE